MKQNIIFFLTILMVPIRLSADPVDNPKTLEWVQKMASMLEDRLTNAINMGDEAVLLVKLMESARDFDAVALTGLYCSEARVAAENGRNFCDWLNLYTLDKDLNALILRAQEARRQAARMHQAAGACKQAAIQNPSDEGFSLSDIILGNAETIEHDLFDGLASQNFHILSQKIEHAERSFRDTEKLAAQLLYCEPIRLAAQTGIEACMDALAAKNWTMVSQELKKATDLAAQIKNLAANCQ